MDCIKESLFQISSISRQRQIGKSTVGNNSPIHRVYLLFDDHRPLINNSEARNGNYGGDVCGLSYPKYSYLSPNIDIYAILRSPANEQGYQLV